MSTKTADIMVAGIILCLGLVIGYDTWRLGSGWSTEGPQAGFFPFIMTLLMLAGGVIAIRQAIKGTSSVKGSKPFVVPGGMKPVLTVLIPAMGMVLLTEVIGLYLAAMLYLIGYIRLVGQYRWQTVLPIGILIPLAFYILFEKMFLIPMPMGMFGDLVLRF